MNPRCERCGGSVQWDREHPTDAPVLKCLLCGRQPGPPRAHEEPEKENKEFNFVPGLTNALNDARRVA